MCLQSMGSRLWKGAGVLGGGSTSVLGGHGSFSLLVVLRRSRERPCQQLQAGLSAPGRSTQRFLPSWDYLSPRGVVSGTVPGERQQGWHCPAPCVTGGSRGCRMLSSSKGNSS